MEPIRVLVVGCGNMGSSHARAYHALPGFQIVGLVSRDDGSGERVNEQLGGGYPVYHDVDEALAATRPAAVSVNTYPGTHYEIALKGLDHGAHLFVEKPLAETVEQARDVLARAAAADRQVVIGYILRVHPAWKLFTEKAKELGKPLVMRMNLNQQSRGKEWRTHKNLMDSMSPIVDCGVHYVDVMCQMTGSKPVRVSAIGARLTDELKPGMYNYGQLQVTFEDGSVGWYEAGWGPMMSETAFFVKDVIGPRGCVSIVDSARGERSADSADIDSHTKTNTLRVHWQERDANDEFVRADEFVSTADEPDHDALCRLEQQLFERAIRGEVDLAQHREDAVQSMRIVLAADEAFRTGRTIEL
ncbi:MAG: Gfo/Idh/MocA family oxidoreductase [Planctomycetes bacterium]|nr:Gfo/Idh/MocA family oxidoreductase [Planctomycetota bacterium]